MPDKPPLITLDNLCLSIAGRVILDRVSFSVRRGEIVTVIGPNGAGKSTVMKIALGLITPNSGTVQKSAPLRIGYMPQKIMIDHILPLTVRAFLKLRPGTGDRQIIDILKQMGLSAIADSPVQKISGGEMQRVLFARALLGDPDLLVLDEPVQGVDVAGQRELYRLIARIRDEQNCGILMISHDLHMVMAETDRVICLNRHVCCHGAPENIQDHPEYHALLGWQGAGVALYSHAHDHRHDTKGNIVPVAPSDPASAEDSPGDRHD